MLLNRIRSPQWAMKRIDLAESISRSILHKPIDTGRCRRIRPSDRPRAKRGARARSDQAAGGSGEMKFAKALLKTAAEDHEDRALTIEDTPELRCAAEDEDPKRRGVPR